MGFCIQKNSKEMGLEAVAMPARNERNAFSYKKSDMTKLLYILPWIHNC